ncbi:MAG: hypothetical protein E3J52_10885 [Promethearchaeota archaeon]|nr:MAG: hypothetical protein E3J52_10885 [Candidatus Lokiarchaeota archaeon]
MSEHERIRDIIMQHIGKNNAISSREIANRIGIDAGSSKVIIRKKIKETMIKYELPIAATNKGYYLMENDLEDLKRYRKSLAKRALDNVERGILVRRFFSKYHNREELELVGEIIEVEEEDEEEDFEDVENNNTNENN